MNAIAWATIRLRGTWKSYVFTTGGYAVLIGMLFTYFPYVSGSTTRAMAGMSTVLISLQVALLLFVGGAAVGNAIRRDLTSGLIASHRLMPVSPAAAVLGYMFGPSLQILALGGVNLIAGCMAAAMAGLSISNWLTTNAVILLLVFFLWTFVAFTGFLAKNAFGGMIGILFASFSGGGFLLALVPAVALLVTPIVTGLLAAITRGGDIQFSIGFGYAIIGQLLFGAIFFRGAMRRYRRDDIPALGTLLSFLLLGVWVITSAVAVLRWDLFAPFNMRRGRDITISAQCVAATVSSMVVALVGISAAAKAATEWTRSVLTAGFASDRRPVAPPALAILAALLIFALALGLRPRPEGLYQGSVDPNYQFLDSRGSLLFAGRVAVVAAIYLLSMSYLLRVLFRAAGKPFILMAIWTALTWLIPFGLEAARQAALTTSRDPIFSRWSPIGELIEIWTHPDHRSIVGIAVQLLIAAVPAALFYSTEPKAVRAKLAAA